MSATGTMPTATLRGGLKLPLVGFGTWPMTGQQAHRAVSEALEAGYRLIDTATMYRNEREVGRAIADSGLRRDQLVITTKLPQERAGRERETIEASLEALGVDQVDLWLIHWPPGGDARPDSWAELLRARSDGLAHTVGVSNYSPSQLDELHRASGEMPPIDQIPWGPSRFDAQLMSALAERNVVLESYSPLKNTNLRDPVLNEIAGRHGVTAAQVVVRWHLEHGFVAIPKSSTRPRIAENLDVLGFSLDPQELQRLDALGR